MARCFIILGAPFSGIGKLTAMFPRNAYISGPAVTTLHRRLLNSSGASWDDPKEVVWNDAFRAVRDSIIEEMSHYDIWAIADSLTPFTIRGWLEALDDYKIMAIINDPMPFTEALSKAYGLMDCMTIWRRYNDKILALEYEFGPFPSIRLSSKTFDSDVSELFHKVGLR